MGIEEARDYLTGIEESPEQLAKIALANKLIEFIKKETQNVAFTAEKAREFMAQLLVHTDLAGIKVEDYTPLPPYLKSGAQSSYELFCVVGIQGCQCEFGFCFSKIDSWSCYFMLKS